MQKADPDSLSPALKIFLLYLALIYSGLPDYLPFIGAIRPGLLCTIAILIIWIRSGNVKRDLGETENLMILFIIIQSFLSIFYAQNNGVVRHFLQAEILNFIGLTIGAALAIKTKRDLRVVLAFFVVMGILIALQVIKNGGVGPERLGDENDVSIPLVVFMAIQWGGIRYFNGIMRYLCILGVVLALGAVVIAGSRGGFLTLLGFLVAMFFLSRSKMKLIFFATTIGLLAIAFFVSEEYVEQMSTITDTSDGTADERLYSWALGVDMFLDNPVLGLGTMQFGWSVERYQRERGDLVLDSHGIRKRRSLAGRTSHSTYFDYLAERGSVGMLFITILFFASMRRLKRCRTKVNPDKEAGQLDLIQYFGASATSGMAGLLVGSAFVTSFYFPTWWLLVGLIIAAWRIAENKLESEKA